MAAAGSAVLALALAAPARAKGYHDPPNASRPQLDMTSISFVNASDSISVRVRFKNMKPANSPLGHLEFYFNTSSKSAGPEFGYRTDWYDKSGGIGVVVRASPMKNNEFVGDPADWDRIELKGGDRVQNCSVIVNEEQNLQDSMGRTPTNAYYRVTIRKQPGCFPKTTGRIGIKIGTKLTAKYNNISPASVYKTPTVDTFPGGGKFTAGIPVSD